MSDAKTRSGDIDMETSTSMINDVMVKQEPVDDPSPQISEENTINNNNNSSSPSISLKNNISKTYDKENTSTGEYDAQPPSSNSGPLRYISRRGRPPGGGYSMKSAHSHYVSFGQSAAGIGSHDFLRQSSLGTPTGSPQDLLKSGLDSGLDSLDARRFGLHCFEGDKNSFRCDGCDVVFGSRDTYAMHMLLRAKNESCVALPTAAISANPENPTPREKFERELREKAMISAIRSQAALMSKAAVAAAAIPRSSVVESAIPALSRSPNSNKDDLSHMGSSDLTAGLSNLFAFDSYGLYMDQRQYRRLLSEYGFRAASSSNALSVMMEQLSCSVCGEVFTNKDALAMHMMFHTREEENESKPVIPSCKIDTSSLGRIMPLPLNIENSGSRSRARSNEFSRKQDCIKPSTGEKQLTAERIAELKRMAIESSLKSSLRKHSNNQSRHIRPKSVSEDTVVTSSAQPRPLSADDAFKLSHSHSDKGVYKSHNTSLAAHHGQNDDDEEENDNSDNGTNKTIYGNSDNRKIPFRKRTLSISEDYLNSYSPYYKRQKSSHNENDVVSLTFRYDHCKSSLSSADMAFPKLCDNHVSSASGPQDSDETSNGSSTAATETITDKVPSMENRKRNPDVASSSLDNLMTSDTVLVPVENLEDEHVNRHEDEVSRRALERDEVSDRTSAIDFSVSKQRGGDIEDNCSTGSSPIHPMSTMNRARKSLDSAMMLSQEETEENEARRGLLQQHHVELVQDGITSAAEPKDAHLSDGRRSYDISSESSRVGEARYCPHCEILFLDVTLFHLHMGLHNVNNPWQCNICGLACTGRLEFNTHVLHY